MSGISQGVGGDEKLDCREGFHHNYRALARNDGFQDFWKGVDPIMYGASSRSGQIVRSQISQVDFADVLGDLRPE